MAGSIIYAPIRITTSLIEVSCEITNPKVALESGEEKTISVTLDKRSFAYYNVDIKDWHVETDEYEVLVCASSLDIRLRDTVSIQSTTKIIPVFHRNTTLGELMANPKTAPILKQLQGMESEGSTSSDAINEEMMAAMMRYMPLRTLLTFNIGQITEEFISILLEQCNNAVKNKI